MKKTCATCKYVHTWLACSGCENDHDEWVEADWLKEHDAEVRADAIEDCIKLVNMMFEPTSLTWSVLNHELKKLKEQRK